MNPAEIEALFSERFGVRPSVIACAPGRLEILGNHTDYNEGFVLSGAVDRVTTVAMAPAQGKVCSILEKGRIHTLDLDEIGTPVKGDWRNYLKGLLIELQKRGVSTGAFNALLTSSVPLSAGMSSSAALEMAFAFALKTIFNIEFPLPEWARIGQGVENHFMGLKTGLLDQFSSLYGKKDSLILCDFRKVEVLKNVPMPPGWSLVVANTLVKHNLVESAYNSRRESCENALKTIQIRRPEIRALRDVDSSLLEKEKTNLNFTDYKRARHVIGENERVLRGTSLLEAGDVPGFGKLLFESHESSRIRFENSCPELDALVEIAKSLPGCAGARLSGGGFGGISIHLVRTDAAEEYRTRLETAYRLTTGKAAETLICKLGDGARIL